MSNRLNIGEFVEEFKSKKIVIPLIQRNYRWEDGKEDRKCSYFENEHTSKYVQKPDSGKRNTAHNLVCEIIDNAISDVTPDLMLGIIVFYQKDNVYQIIDGQQRFITLSLIWRYMHMQKNSSSQNYTWVKFDFERDNEDKNRHEYLFGKDEKTEQLSVDVSRMKKNYQEIERVFNWYKENNDLKLEDVWKYICEHVSFVIRETNSEPIDEFLNINDYKTPFSLCDYIKVFLIQDICEINKDDINKIKSETKNILNLIKEISCYLYSAEYSDVFKLVSSGYDSSPYDIVKDNMRNNVDLLYTGWYGQSGINIRNIEFNTLLSKYHEKSFEFESKRLKYFKNVLKGIAEEIKTTTPDNKEHPNYNAFNAFYSLKRSMPYLRFFSMFKDEDIKESKDPNSVMQEFCLQKFCAKQLEKNNSKSVNDFIQSVLYSENKEHSNNDINDYSIDNSDIDLFFYFHEQYTDIIIKGKSITESDELHEDRIQEKLEININAEEYYADKRLSNGIISVKELFEKTSKIIIPDIQREYIQGSGLDGFFKDICKKYYIKEIEANPISDNCEDFSKAIKELEENSVKKVSDNTIDCDDRNKMNMRFKKCISNYIEMSLFSEDTNIEHDTIYDIYDKIIANTDLNISSNFDKRCTTKNLPWLGAVNKIIKEKAEPYIEKIKESNISPDTTYTSSCVVGNIDTENKFYVYDGQQRITTFVCLTGCMVRKNKVESIPVMNKNEV